MRSNDSLDLISARENVMDNFDIMANGTSMVEFGSLMDKLSASCKQIHLYRRQFCSS